MAPVSHAGHNPGPKNLRARSLRGDREENELRHKYLHDPPHQYLVLDTPRTNASPASSLGLLRNAYACALLVL